MSDEQPRTPLDDQLDGAWERLEAGDAEGALELVDQIVQGGDAPPEAALIAALAWLDLGDPRRAEELLGIATVGIDPADLDLRWARAEVDLALWRVGEARAGFAGIADEEPSVPGLLRLALAEDLLGNHGAADDAVARAIELDGSLAELPRLDQPAFEALVERAAAELPEPFRGRLDEIAVVIDPVPALALGQSQPLDTPPDALGLFVGASDLERHGELSGVPAASIYLYQRNLERASRSAAELEAEVRITLLHEFGHALGFDEDGVDAMGLA